MLTRRKIIGLALVLMFAAWASAALLGAMGQRKLFYEQGAEELYDFWMPRVCLEQGYVGHPEKYKGLVDVRRGKPIEIDARDVVWSDWYTDGFETYFVTGWRDKVYPVFSLLPLKLFPATRFGGYLWSVVAGLSLLCALCLISGSWWPVLLSASMPFLFNLERGNPVWIAAACVGVFLAWWDDEKEWKRMVAAGCLAAAGAMKIAPFILGALYFTKWRWRSVLLCGFLSLLFVFLPWFFISDGFAALSVMIKNAAEHSQYVLRSSDFGLIQLWRSVRLVLGQDVQSPWVGMFMVARISQLLGFGALIVGVIRRDLLLLVGGMLLSAGNMYYYAALYLLPVLVLEAKAADENGRNIDICDVVLWLAMLCPVQLVFRGHSCNQVIGNVALLLLMSRRLINFELKKMTALKRKFADRGV